MNYALTLCSARTQLVIAINNPYGIMSFWVSREIGYTGRELPVTYKDRRDVLLTQTVCSFYFTNC